MPVQLAVSRHAAESSRHFDWCCWHRTGATELGACSKQRQLLLLFSCIRCCGQLTIIPVHTWRVHLPQPPQCNAAVLVLQLWKQLATTMIETPPQTSVVRPKNLSGSFTC